MIEVNFHKDTDPEVIEEILSLLRKEMLPFRASVSPTFSYQGANVHTQEYCGSRPLDWDQETIQPLSENDKYKAYPLDTVILVGMKDRYNYAERNDLYLIEGTEPKEIFKDLGKLFFLSKSGN